MKRNLCGLAVLLVSLVSVALVTVPAEAARPSCFGRTATIVGHGDGAQLKGTRHADVIVGTDGNDQIKGRGGNDRICGKGGDDFIFGGGGNDKLDGGTDSGFGDTLFGQGGDDTIKGGGAPAPDSAIDHNDVASFVGSPNGVTANLATGKATGEGNDTLVGIEQLEGSNFDDNFTADANTKLLIGHDGSDVLDVSAGNFILVAPGEGDDTVTGTAGNRYQVSYDDVPGPVTIDLAAGTVTGAGSDTLHNVPDAIGSPGNDTILGTNGPNLIEGCNGNDTIDTRGNSTDPSDPYLEKDGLQWDFIFGDDCAFIPSVPGNDDITGGPGAAGVCYCAATSAVTVDLAAGTVTGGGGTDTLHSIDAVAGSVFDDTLKGTNGFDIFEVSVGHDTIDGKGGEDAFEANPTLGVTVDLAAGTASGNVAGVVNGAFDFYPATTTLSNIEDVWGTDLGSDSLTGDSGANKLFGFAGDDNLHGANGNDYLDGGDGTDSGDGGSGTDTCKSIESPSGCEQTLARQQLSTRSGGLRSTQSLGVAGFRTYRLVR